MQIEDIDRFIDEIFIPSNIVYKKIENNNSFEIKYEKIIQLSKIANLKASEEEKQYITKKLKEKGIKVIGFCEVDFESDDYIFTRKYQKRTQKSINKEENQKKLEQYIKTRDQSLRNEIVMDNLGIVYDVINSNSNYRLFMYDLQQVGCIALINAIEKFDPSEGAFSTFARSYIEGQIKIGLYDLLGYKNSEYAFYTKNQEVEKEYGEKVVNNPSLSSVVVDKVIESGFRKGHKEENIRRVLINNPVSLDEILEQDEETTVYELGYEVKESDINSCYDEELIKIIQEKIKILKEKQQKLLTMRYGLNNTKAHTLKEIAKEFGVTISAVDANIKTALKNLAEEDEELPKLRYYLHREI